MSKLILLEEKVYENEQTYCPQNLVLSFLGHQKLKKANFRDFAAINNFKATSKRFSSIVKKSSLKLRSKALKQTEKGGSNESNEISLYCSGCAAAAAL